YHIAPYYHISSTLAPIAVAVGLGAFPARRPVGRAVHDANFLSNELVLWVRSTYRATDNPAQTVIGGSSLGGLASTFNAGHRTDVFGKVLSQSGSYWGSASSVRRFPRKASEDGHGGRSNFGRRLLRPAPGLTTATSVSPRHSSRRNRARPAPLSETHRSCPAS